MRAARRRRCRRSRCRYRRHCCRARPAGSASRCAPAASQQVRAEGGTDIPHPGAPAAPSARVRGAQTRPAPLPFRRAPGGGSRSRPSLPFPSHAAGPPLPAEVEPRGFRVPPAGGLVSAWPWPLSVPPKPRLGRAPRSALPGCRSRSARTKAAGGRGALGQHNRRVRGALLLSRDWNKSRRALTVARPGPVLCPRPPRTSFWGFPR